jgi:hypothetical protein
MTEAIDADPDTILTIPYPATFFVPDRGAPTPIGGVKSNPTVPMMSKGDSDRAHHARE